MKVIVMGTGYVGLVTGADLATRGHDVVCVDVLTERIEGLRRGVMPFFEPGLEELVHRAGERLSFSTDGATVMRDADVVLCAVGTPLGSDGHADLDAVFAVAKMFAEYAPERAVLINKSTVPVGTAAKCRDIVGRDAVVSNPEFLSQSTAVHDTAQPTRIVVGTRNPEVRVVMRELYQSFITADVPYIEMSVESAEAVKCASNAFLATKISFINEIANFCARAGGDVRDVAHAMGLDPRIGPHFLRAGLGYGGGCLPKDVQSLIAAGKDVGYVFHVLPAVEAVNAAQRFVLFERAKEELGSLRGKRVAVLGLAFKPGTDDVRGAPALDVIDRLLAEGADVVAFDPAAMERAKSRFPQIGYVPTALEAIQGADAVFVFTEWPEFAALDLAHMTAIMRTPFLFDGRGIFADKVRPSSLRYFSLGCG